MDGGRTDGPPIFTSSSKSGEEGKKRKRFPRAAEAKHRGQGKVRPKSPCQQRKQGKNAFSRESSRATYVCCTRQGPKNSHIPPPDRYSLFWPRMRSIVSHSHLEVSGETRRCYSRISLITRRRRQQHLATKEKSTLVEVKDLWTNKGV